MSARVAAAPEAPGRRGCSIFRLFLAVFEFIRRRAAGGSACRGGIRGLHLVPLSVRPIDARFTGWHVDGGYAQYMSAPAEFVYPLPDALGAAESVAPLLCGGIIGYRALRQANVRPGCRLGLYGFGASAHIALQIALNWGCRVAVFSRTQDHRRLALELGAEWAGSARDTPPEPLDAAVIFAPAGWLVPEALRVLDRGGTLALAGIYMTPTPALEYAMHLYYEKTLRSVANATRQDGFDLLDLAAEIPVATQTEVYPLAEANAVLRRLKQGRVQGAAVLRIDA